jgi:hypothetical protein
MKERMIWICLCLIIGTVAYTFYKDYRQAEDYYIYYRVAYETHKADANCGELKDLPLSFKVVDTNMVDD